MGERYSDFDIDSTQLGWTITAWDNESEETKKLEVAWPELRNFVMEYYDMSQPEAGNYLLNSDQSEDNLLLTELFKNKLS